MKKLLYMIIVSGLTALVLFGCSDRGVNDQPMKITEGGVNLLGGEGEAVFSDYFTLQIGNEFAQMDLRAYEPRVAFPHINGGENKPVPVLFLLTPQDGDGMYYFDHGLKELADELISTGQIQPMEIVCIPNNRAFGGFFYANNYTPAGSYDDFFSGELLDFVYNRGLLSPIDPSVKKPGIGGVGMGAYGAMRAAIMNPGQFGAVSITDGPLDFDGASGNGGFIPTFTEALTEQGLINQTGWKVQFDSAGNWHTSRLIIGGSYAFSPEDTLVDFTAITIDNVSTLEQGDSLVQITLNNIDSLSTVIGNTTIIKNLYTPFQDHNNTVLSYAFHLPFDSTGAVYTPVWNRWLDNNLENMMTGGELSGTNIWVGHSPSITFGNYSEQTASFISTLQGSYPVTVFNYDGYEGHPVNKDEYVYDLMKEMLIFHSDNFGD